MQVVKLGKSEREECEDDDPGLPAIELVVSIDHRSNKQLDSGFGHE